jgi:hypothetical protein
MQRTIVFLGLAAGVVACGAEIAPVAEEEAELLTPVGASAPAPDAGILSGPVVSPTRPGVVVGPPVGGYPPPPPPCNSDGVCDANESCGAGCQDCCVDCINAYPPPLNNCCAYLSLPWPYFSCCIQNNGAPIGQWICP